MARTTEKRGKWNTNTVWPGIWRETLKNVEKGKAHCRTWTMARKLKIMENEKHKFIDMK